MRYSEPPNQVYYTVQGRYIAVARPNYNFESAKQVARTNLHQWYDDCKRQLDEEFQAALRDLDALTPADVPQDEGDDDFLSQLRDLD